MNLNSLRLIMYCCVNVVDKMLTGHDGRGVGKSIISVHLCSN